ncbi:metalloproteinase inhibitor 3-like [Diadema setosum]|uniref:metalloproteinase inhibitor 3-like n=1 Tax=Diadema setosum TaxID=31175 RepID=UPI003B3B602F
MHPMEVVLLVAAMLACMVHDAIACSCQPSHPQDHFCRSAYVIRARIKGKELIYPEPQPEPMAESSSFSEVSFSDSDMVALETNEGLIPPVEGLIAAPLGLAAKPREPEVKLPAGVEPMYMDENRPIKLEYTVKVEKIYKGDDLLMAKSNAKITTAAIDAACGVTDLEIDGVYILAGTFYNAELRLSTCNWIAGYKNITKRQRQGIKHNYKMQCGKCDISPCYGRYCPTDPVPNLCMWDMANLRTDCESQFAYCTRDAQDQCNWYGKGDMKRCVRRRVKSRRRNQDFLP